MHLITSKFDQNIIYWLDQKLDQHIKAGCNLDAILNESLMHLITSKMDQNIIHKLDKKIVSRLHLDCI